MKISRIKIHNYRSIKDVEIDCRAMIVLLGQNNHGKSNILRAVEFALTSSSKPEPDDFYAFRQAEDPTLWVELTFTKLTEQEETTFKKYIRSDSTFCYRKTATLDENSKVEIKYNGYLEEPQEEWLKSSNASNYTSRDSVNATPLSGFVPAAGRITKGMIEAAQLQYIEGHRDELNFSETLEDGPMLGQKNVAAGVLPDFFLIPAVRDLSEESKVKSTAIFGKLLSLAVSEMAASDERFKQIQIQLSELVSVLNATAESAQRPSQLVSLETSIEEELKDWGVKVSVEVTPPEIEKIFELGTDIHLDDGLKTLAKHKGHGLQRAVIFGLMKAWAKAMRRPTESDASARKASDSIIFAIEEPELFLHPQAQRALSKTLRLLSESLNNQVFICSHSAHFVDLDHYRDIIITRKHTPEGGTEIVQCIHDLFEGEELVDRKRRFHMAYWVNPDRGEMFFAKQVVLVEGETEKSIFPYLAQKMGSFSEDVSIVDCGSKHNLPLYIAIANAFKLKYIVVHDEDPLPNPIPEEWSQDKLREKQRTYDLNREIQSLIDANNGSARVLCPDFEGCSGVSRTQAGKKGKALAALEYFREMEADEIGVEITSVINHIYGGGN